MAPPQLFINKKTLDVEKLSENNKEDVCEDFEPENTQEQETEKEDKSDDCDSENSKDTNESNANRKARSLSILTNIASPILVFTGLAIALVGAFLLDDRYFLVLGLHLFSLGWLHFLQAPGTKFEQLISSFLARWDIRILDASGEDLVHLRHARILICVILCIANVIFTTLEIHFSNFLFKKNECYNYRCNSVSYGLQTACFIFSIWLAFPWPLLLCWLISTKTLPCQETLTDMLQKENIIASVFTQVYFYLACGGCLREEVEKSFGTMFIFDLSIVLGLLIGIFYILSGLKAFFKLVASLLKMILVLPLLIGLTVIAVTKSFAGLLNRKEEVDSKSETEDVWKATL